MQLGPTAQQEHPPLSVEQPQDAAAGGDQGDLTTPPHMSDTGATATEPAPTGLAGWVDQIRAENPLLPNLLLVGGVILMVFVMMRLLRRNVKASRARDNAMGTPSERIAEIRDRAESSMEPSRKLMLDAEEMARRLGATLDNKAARLELLIEEADAKLAQMNRALAKNPNAQIAPQNPAPPASPPAEAPVQQPQAPAPSQPARMIDPSLLDRARVEQDIEERQSRGSSRPGPTESNGVSSHAPQPEPAKPAEPASISEQIHTLAQGGMSSHEIALKLKQPIGQVELILNLQKRPEYP